MSVKKVWSPFFLFLSFLFSPLKLLQSWERFETVLCFLEKSIFIRMFRCPNDEVSFSLPISDNPPTMSVCSLLWLLNDRPDSCPALPSARLCRAPTPSCCWGENPFWKDWCAASAWSKRLGMEIGLCFILLKSVWRASKAPLRTKLIKLYRVEIPFSVDFSCSCYTE